MSTIPHDPNDIKALFDESPPEEKGFIHYMLAETPAGGLLPRTCPYAKGSPDFEAWQRGEQRAVTLVQDLDD